MKNDKIYLTRAIELAKKGRFTTSPNPMVGCVIVNNNKIVGEGYHFYPGENHAEINALKMSNKLSIGATAYINLEPCFHYGKTPPCVQALVSSGISRVVFSILDPNPKVSGKSFNYLKKIGIDVSYGLMKEESEDLNKFFIKKMTTGFPWISLKLATSLDGRIALKNGSSKWITSTESRNDVQLYRAKNDAILSTSSTIIKDNPLLTVRKNSLPLKIQKLYKNSFFKQPIRIIIDSSNRINPKYKIFKNYGKILLIHLLLDNHKWLRNVKQIIIPKYVKNKNFNYIDIIYLFKYLGSKNINSVWIESGSNFAGNLIKLKIIDELILYQSPKLLGSDSYPLFKIKGLLNINKAPKFNIINFKKIGEDIRFKLKPIYKK
ncbi:bifunctional diaminohydroxyphosphoribosylaminopyrimidine deaminase/5-amino-6-(5-phosphoribosylamino)uracil reductase RibD [Sodalis-like secondary symbiont of Drepanosiphum platanoidis]|uniref:bifunctional diaminohydroxyphosphoribosylaminopyrimidine deaminase/5-amino-6-(5-phosphoribosylamino)uracil reductase RibD n=1 Tax=Sodalis-like secondary symbiont of Drepanosiphum platanoidis TaxID=2994493 RepID=UPI003463BD08